MLQQYPTRATLIRLLRESGGCTLNDLRRLTRLSRSVLRQHLARLQRDGIVETRLERRPSGRPPLVYRLTPQAGLASPETYVTFLQALVAALRAHGQERIEELFQQIADQVGARYPEIRSLPDVEARLEAARRLIFRDVDATEVRRTEDGYEFSLYTCPLAPVAMEFRDLCCVTRSLLRGLVGEEVTQSEWIIRGDPRCTFEVRVNGEGGNQRWGPRPEPPIAPVPSQWAESRPPGRENSVAGVIPSLTIRWHGRGGSGAATAAALLAEAIIDAGGYAQAAPEFGPERRGAPVQAFTRIGAGRIRQRGPIEEPDVVVVLDARLVRSPEITSGVRPGTRVLVNAPGAVTVPQVPADHVITVDASRIARQTVGRDIPNIPMLAAVVTLFTPLQGEAFLAWLEKRLAEQFCAELAAANRQAARIAIAEVEDAYSVVAGA